MKTLIYLPMILFCFLASQFHGQTFSNNTSATWNSSLTKTISVSGVGTLAAGSNVLKQVNLKLGQSGSGVGSGTSTYFIKLTSPTSGTVVASCTLCPVGGFNSTGVDLIDIKYRDNANLQYPNLTSGSRGAEPWNIGYYKIELSSGGFTNFNGINADGTWTLTITESQSSNGLDFQNIDLIFGPPFNITDITATSTNDACATPQCFDNSSILIAKNQGYIGNNTTDPVVSSPYVSGCDWNGVDNNTAWFYFRPTSSTASITVSGLQDVMQALVIKPTFSCTQGSQTLPTGGCPLSSSNDTYTSPRYTSSSGSSANFQFKLSGLTPNLNYYLVIDGTGGNISKLYIELTGNATSCLTLLPVELIDFNYDCNNERIKLFWKTSSEVYNKFFTILGSEDANEWIQIGSKLGIGKSSEINYYEFEVPSQYNYLKYFKLAQHDFDSNTKFSNIISVDCDSKNSVDFYPNPFNNELNFTIKSNKSVQYEITTVLGQVLNSGIVNTENSRISLDNLASDIYFIKINNSKVHKIIKQ